MNSQAWEKNERIRFSQTECKEIFDYSKIRQWGKDNNFPFPKDDVQMGSIVAIDFSNMSINQLPDLSILKNLEALNLSNNLFKDTLPSLPESILSLTLDNNLYTSIPREIEKCQRMQSLSVSNNLLTEIPEFIWNMEHLVFLNVSKNKISKVLFLGKEMFFAQINLSQNQVEDFKFSGDIFLLDLSDNRIRDTSRLKFGECNILSLAKNPLEKVSSSIFFKIPFLHIPISNLKTFVLQQLSILYFFRKRKSLSNSILNLRKELE